MGSLREVVLEIYNKPIEYDKQNLDTLILELYEQAEKIAVQFEDSETVLVDNQPQQRLVDINDIVPHLEELLYNQLNLPAGCPVDKVQSILDKIKAQISFVIKDVNKQAVISNAFVTVFNYLYVEDSGERELARMGSVGKFLNAAFGEAEHTRKKREKELEKQEFHIHRQEQFKKAKEKLESACLKSNAPESLRGLGRQLLDEIGEGNSWCRYKITNTMKVVSKTLSNPTLENAGFCQAQAQRMPNHSPGANKKCHALELLLMIAGVAIIVASVAAIIATYGFSTPISIGGIASGVTMVTTTNIWSALLGASILFPGYVLWGLSRYLDAPRQTLNKIGDNAATFFKNSERQPAVAKEASENGSVPELPLAMA